MSNINNEMKEIFYEFKYIHDEILSLNNDCMYMPQEMKDNLPFKKLKLNTTETSVLYVLLHNENPMTIGDIVKYNGTHLYKQIITQPVNKLAKMGIVRRFQKENNLRNVYVELTEHGRELCDEHFRVRDEYLNEKFYSVASFEEIQELLKASRYYREILLRLKNSNAAKQRP